MSKSVQVAQSIVDRLTRMSIFFGRQERDARLTIAEVIDAAFAKEKPTSSTDPIGGQYQYRWSRMVEDLGAAQRELDEARQQRDDLLAACKIGLQDLHDWARGEGFEDAVRDTVRQMQVAIDRVEGGES